MQVLESHIVQHIAFIPWQQTISVLEMIVKGFIIGIVVSAPMGPTGVLCVQRTMNKGRAYGLATGLGASLSDIIYALITGYGMSFVMDLVNNAETKFMLQMLGSIILLIFGIISFRANPTKNMHISSKQKGTLWHNGITAFLVTFSNPLIIFLFMGCFAQFAFVVPNHPLEMFFGYLSIVFGALLWWYGLTWVIDKVRTIFDTTGIIIINKVIGSVVIIFSLIVLFGTMFNLYTLPEF